MRSLPLMPALRAAELAASRVVLEFLFLKEGLFFGAEHKRGPAIATR
jgi:hypothetical protein